MRDSKTVQNIKRKELKQLPDLATADYYIFDKELCQQINDAAMTQKLLTFFHFFILGISFQTALLLKKCR